MAGILRRLKLSRNEITGDEIKTKVTSKEYEEGYDRIFKKKPQSLDAAYERRAMMQGLIVSPLFDENKELIDTKECKCSFRTKLVGDGCSVCNPELAKDLLEDWPGSEERMDVIGQNGNVGYTITDIDNSNPWCTKVTVEENKD
jgi:hypothetical protein